MSGYRQHYIPRFLQRGFISHKLGKESYTWVFSKYKGPYNANIKNYGLERNFYITDDGISADEIITKKENEFYDIIQKLRKEDMSALNNPQLPFLLSHFLIRTKHIRDSLANSGEYIILQLLDKFSDEEELIKILDNNPEIMNQSIYNEIIRFGLTKYLVSPLMEYIRNFIPNFIKLNISTIKEIIEKEKIKLKGRFHKSLKNSLIKLQVGDSNISPHIYVDLFSKLNYRLIRSSCKVILGDSIIFFHVNDSRKYIPIIDGTYELKSILLPIDSEKVLIGGNYDNELNLPDDINRGITQCSLEYFISSQNLHEISILSNEIGKKASFFSVVFQKVCKWESDFNFVLQLKLRLL